MTDIEGFLTIYGHSDNLLNNNSNFSFSDNAQKLKLAGSFYGPLMLLW